MGEGHMGDLSKGEITLENLRSYYRLLAFCWLWWSYHCPFQLFSSGPALLCPCPGASMEGMCTVWGVLLRRFCQLSITPLGPASFLLRQTAPRCAAAKEETALLLLLKSPGSGLSLSSCYINGPEVPLPVGPGLFISPLWTETH